MHRFLVGSVLACLCGGAVATSAQLLNTHAGLGAPTVGGGGGSGGGEGTIVFVAAGDIGNNGGSSGTLSGSYSQSNGINEGLVVCITGGVIGTDADDITAVSYDSISGTLLTKFAGSPVNSGTRYQYIYYVPLGNTSAGSHTVSITASSSHYLLGVVGEYSNIQQSTTPDAAVNRAVAAGNDTIPFTTSTTGSWVMLCEQSSGGSTVADSGDVLRIPTATFANPTLFDSNGTVAPGANNLLIGSGGGSSIITAGAALKPG